MQNLHVYFGELSPVGSGYIPSSVKKCPQLEDDLYQVRERMYQVNMRMYQAPIESVPSFVLSVPSRGE